MNTWKLLLSILIVLEMVSCILFAMTVNDLQKDESRNRFNIKVFNNHRDKTSSGKYRPKNPDDNLDDNDDRSHNVNYDFEDSRYRNDRAIHAPGSAEEASTKIGQQTITSDMPNGKQKSHAIARQKMSKLRNVTIADGVCGSLDIRNNIRSFEVLRNCRIIEGFLNIILIANITESQARNLSFPKLREITEYLLIYRVDNFTTLRYLFPNLEVIRGDTLFTDYSLMIYEMNQLTEIGMVKLMKISRGGVRIERNPVLCYTDTIDWKSIVLAGALFFATNQHPSKCPACPSSCPDSHCWSEDLCQKSMESICHPLCLGGCFGPTEKDCYVCKTIRHEDMCMEKCPPHLYAFRERRCITALECIKMKPAHLRKDDKAKNWRIFNNSCVTECPVGYDEIIDQNNVTVCKTCVGDACQKFENGGVVRHISDFQPFRGMSVIDGSLEFQIGNSYPTIESELIDAFGAIEEITGYLKVARSSPLTSLEFLKKLRVIRGRKLDMNNASLVILDNSNLSNLFHESQKIELENGRLFIHDNPKLCMSKITKLANMVGITNYTVLEIHPDSNGDKVACDIVNINITVQNKGTTYANLVWDVYEPSEGQNLINYMLSYTETDNPNVTFESNPCSSRKWQIVDVEIPLNNSPNIVISKLITDLKPYTSYGVYVKTLAVRNRSSFRSPTGQSKVILFRTDPDIPTVPANVETIMTTETEILIQWDEPTQPNGPIAYYIISGFIRIEDEDFLSSRDYCKHGIVNEVEKIESPKISFKAIIDDPKSCCKKEVVKYKKFEILCYDNMTTGYIPQGRYNYCDAPRDDKFNIEENFTFEKNFIYNTKPNISNNTYYSFIFNVSGEERSYVLKNLRYYSLYTIAVTACGSTLNNGTELCSLPQYVNAKTERRPDADNVYNVQADVTNDTLVTIKWDPVQHPNGLTVAYIIEYTNTIIKSATKTSACISQGISRKKRNTYDIPNLSPGKYSTRVRSLSLAGEGNWSQEVYFTIGMKDDNTFVATIIVTITCIVAIIIIGFFLLRSYRNKKKQERLIASVNPDYIESKYVRDSWEVSRDNIKLSEELGLGNFGMVYRGVLNGNIPVAIKTIPVNYTEEDKNEFLNEASVMKNFSSFHLVKLLGVISEGDPPYVIMELMENGDLKSYLRRIRDVEPGLDVSRIIRMAGEIADGMAYLESKKFVHRDLAARNCMVSNDLVCKIGDFGMARDIYETDYYKIGQKGLLPIRWMAPENLSDGVFTSDSDVWSFGVVLYEILTMGELPYQGFSNDEVLNHVLRKGTVTIPRNCPEIILKLMERCFRWRPNERPTFIEIVSELESFLGQDFCEKSFYHSEEGIELRNSGLKKVYHNAAQIRFHWGNDSARWVREFEDNVTLLDQTRAGTSRSKIFKNGFQHLGNIAAMEEIPLDSS
ncbi:hypothetical protein PV327_006663 [Microctonus hyperodae]|uniref:receptor protein-tyrosine kinase n=1 Tax=Microctonus hyperodae TaxID=165561 RepID=A0AA39F4R7_MICHY|nr:hypothetical protein PV327_006663 [Microctonus hyperodae]